MKTNIYKGILTVSAFGIFMIPALAYAADQSTPATGGENISAADTSSAPVIPNTSGDNVSSADTQNDSDISVTPVTGGDNVSSADTSSASNPGGNGNGGNNTTSSSSSGGTVSLSTGGGSVVTVTSATSTCPLITSYMKLDTANNSVEVAKLQAWLRNTQGLDVDVTGTFDAKTDAAVKKFQKDHLEEILGPWESTRPTGFVYITTTKFINKLACNQPLVLTPSELAIIQDFINHMINGGTTTSEIGGNIDLTNPLSADGATLTPSGNVAGVGTLSLAARFWAFIKTVFAFLFQ